MQYEGPQTSALPNQAQSNQFGQVILGQNNAQMN